MDTITGAGTFPFVEIGFMPEALSTQPDPVPERRHRSRSTAAASTRPPTTRSGRPDPRVGDACERTLSERRGKLAVGAVERAGHRLLARHLRRLREALRLHRGGAAPGAPERAARRTGGASRRRQLPDAVPAALRDRHQRRHGETGTRLDLVTLPRQRRRHRHRGPRRDGPRQPAAASPGRLRRGRGRPAVQADAHLHQRGRPRRLRGLPGQRDRRRARTATRPRTAPTRSR